jgi:Na+/H+-dicarboxylate symporter
MSRLFTVFILVGMVLGVLTGWACHELLPDPSSRKTAVELFSLCTDLFLRLIRMIIAPLVIATLFGGIARMGDGAAVGRVGVKTIGWFLCASLVSLLIGLCLASLMNLGVGLHRSPPPGAAGLAAGGLSAKEFLAHVVPTSVVDAMAKNEILQIVVFSVFAGIAASAIGDAAAPLVRLMDAVGALMLRVTGYVMLVAPLAVFGALAATVTTEGIGVLSTYAAFVGGFYLALGLLWAVLIGAGFIAVGPRVFRLVRALRAPLLVAFATSTSEAAYPQTLDRLERFGVSSKVASFVLPLGYSFNLDGSMIYCTFAVMFIAQAYGVELSLAQKGTMILILMITSKGIAGVPRASLVVISATLGFFKIPEAGLLLILAVDHFLDMGRSTTNVLGNSIAAAAVARWEGELGPEAA